ncbi:MAG: helix-turn-helix domain-containing protein [Ruminococcus sp.]|nr:helix-turn-helix domain-containing protein [Ruminococcus sp.]
MVEQWAAEVVAKLRMAGMTQKEFARQCGYSEEYLSQILRGKKDTPKSKRVISEQLEKLTADNTTRLTI